MRELFGGEDKLIKVRGTEADIAAASRRARERLIALVKPRFLKGFPERDRLEVKAPFDENGRREWMWVDVTSWAGRQIGGILTSQPVIVHGSHEGDRVTVREDELFDYLVIHADGSTEGNETQALLEAAGR
ncbi:MAG TPA: DUF2314 domain-containing protein [Myxococcales bacterium]|nr:DUF2314 domain-containing protein [Myxococcales bacterium]